MRNGLTQDYTAFLTAMKALLFPPPTIIVDPKGVCYDVTVATLNYYIVPPDRNPKKIADNVR
jgi:hypothetical protein